MIRICGQRTERSGAAKRGGKRPRDTQKAQKDGNTEKKDQMVNGVHRQAKFELKKKF